MLAEIYMKLEAAVRAAKEAATTARPHDLCRSPCQLPRRPNHAFYRVLAICPLQPGAPPRIQNISGLPQGPADPASGRLKGAAKRLSRNNP